MLSDEGLRESAMMLAFSYAGLAESDGLIISILYGAVSLAVCAVGSIVRIASGHRWHSINATEADTLPQDPSI
jgi:hypothetical protein